MDVFIDGFLSGSIQSIVGHPFDTIKTRLQLGKPFERKGYYKGFYPALLCGCFQNGFLFYIEKKSQIEEGGRLFSGLVSGALTSVLVCPLEKWKSRIQMGITTRDTSPWYRGMGMTVARDSIGFASYFYCYEWCREQKYPIFWSGGIAGVVSWIFSYPFDVMKTRLQVGMKPSSFMSWKGHGLGLTVVMSRAFLVNGSIFYSFEFLENCR